MDPECQWICAVARVIYSIFLARCRPLSQPADSAMPQAGLSTRPIATLVDRQKYHVATICWSNGASTVARISAVPAPLPNSCNKFSNKRSNKHNSKSQLWPQVLSNWRRKCPLMASSHCSPLPLLRLLLFFKRKKVDVWKLEPKAQPQPQSTAANSDNTGASKQRFFFRPCASLFPLKAFALLPCCGQSFLWYS